MPNRQLHLYVVIIKIYCQQAKRREKKADAITTAIMEVSSRPLHLFLEALLPGNFCLPGTTLNPFRKFRKYVCRFLYCKFRCPDVAIGSFFACLNRTDSYTKSQPHYILFE